MTFVARMNGKKKKLYLYLQKPCLLLNLQNVLNMGSEDMDTAYFSSHPF